MELTVQNPGRYGGLQIRRLRSWLRRMLADLAPGASSLTIRLVSDREMRRLNRTWRGRDRTTDVISFPGSESPDGTHLGDLVIAVPTARRQAAAEGRGLQRELRRLILHGVLHCLGYDHDSDDGTMSRLESKLRRRWVTDDA